LSNRELEYYTSPRGIQYPTDRVLDVLSELTSNDRLKRIDDVLDTRLTSLSLGVEDLHHEHNGAACLRTAEGLGIHHVFAAEIRNAYPHPELGERPKVSDKKTRIPKGITMHAHRWVDLSLLKGDDERSAGVELVQAAQADGYQVFGAGPRGQFDLLDLPLDKPIMVLFGNEALGLREDTMAACDGVFKIPMYGFTESFNISVSVGMVLEQLGAKIRANLAQHGISGELSEAQKRYWKAQWIARDMRQVDVILKALLSDEVI
jgi:tRNA (guanosine-2'-O-)-methyltransferase